MITADRLTLVQPSHRHLVTPYLASDYLSLENMIYSFAAFYCAQYKGGYWQMPICQTPIGHTYFLYPETGHARLHVTNPDNYFEGALNEVEFGLGVTLIALSNQSFAGREVYAGRNHQLLTEWMDANNPSEELLAFLD